MAKASFKLPDGTTVDVEGSSEEIRKILSLYQHDNDTPTEQQGPPKPAGKARLKQESEGNPPNLTELVNKTKESEEFDQIEKNILENGSVVDRLLLPLYIVHQYFSNRTRLTSGDIAKYLSQFSLRVLQSNIAHSLSSSASSYVIGDRIRKPRVPVHYLISRKGIAYLKGVIEGTSDD